MKYYTLYDAEHDAVKKVSERELVYQMYYEKLVIPSREIQKRFKVEVDVAEYRRDISTRKEYIPLFDVVGYNLFIISKEEVFFYVKERDFRLPTPEMFDDFKKQLRQLSSLKVLEENETMRKRVLLLITRFLACYDLDLLEQTFLQVIYHHTKSIGQNITYCVKPSFIPYVPHHRPYYNQDEILKLALNMGVVENVMKGNYNLRHLCDKIKQNDIQATILHDHQQYIEESGLKSLVYFYSFIGSYSMNNYLRRIQVRYRNPSLEKFILQFWSLIRHAPPFDKTYVIYRIVGTDNFLMNLKIGDIYRDNGFLSCSRNPFYNDETNQFGYILWKIKIPKNVVGVGLCIEPYSMFQYEEEIILPPQTGLRLVSIDNASIYHHTNEAFQEKISGIYEFEWIGRKAKVQESFPYTPLRDHTVLNFLSTSIHGANLDDKTTTFVSHYVNENGDFLLFDAKHEREYRVHCGFYDSTTLYRNHYYYTTPYGFYMYIQHDHTGNIEYMAEFGASGEMSVNYHLKDVHGRKFWLSDDAVLSITAQIAHGFSIRDVLIHPNYQSCHRFKDTKYFTHENEHHAADITSYNVDMYRYFKHNETRFADNARYIAPNFYYHDLDALRSTPCDAILSETDRNMLFKLYRKFFRGKHPDNIAHYYLFLIEHLYTHIHELQQLIAQKRPRYAALFTSSFHYHFDASRFLYTHKLIKKLPVTKYFTNSA